MAGLSQLLETARRALMAQQIGISVTGHNIANAGTAGYTRQRVDLVPSLPSPVQRGLLGTGVMVAGVTSIRNQFLDQQIRATNSELGRARTEASALAQIEATFAEPSDSSLGRAIARFFGSWQDLSTRPEDTVARNAVLQSGTQLGALFNSIRRDVTTFRDQLKDDIQAKVDRINTLTAEISELSRAVTASGAGGISPNDARDQLNLRLNELAQLAPISSAEDDRGGVMVAIEGVVVASTAGSTRLTVSVGSPTVFGVNAFDQIQIGTETGTQNIRIRTGELGGALGTYNTSMPETLGRLDTLARTIVDTVNGLHSTGFGRGVPPPTGILFFSGTDAASIAIDLTDTSGGAAPGSAPSINNIAAAVGPPPPSAGDNRLALQIANLLQLDQGSLGGSSMEAFYTRIVSDVATRVNSAKGYVSTHELVRQQLEVQRDAVSGVSIDEEMTNLIMYQRAFDAAARLVATTDEMMQTILNMVAR